MTARPTVRRGALAAILLASSILGLTVPRSASAAPHAAAVVTVNAAAPVGVIPATAFGLNTAVWDGDLTAPSVPALLRRLDVGVLRYPGGSTSDGYDWETNTMVPGQSGYVNPADSFSHFMTVANEVGATPIITVNYGSNFSGTGGGEPSEAAAWVRDADVTHHDHVQYWEIGNEVYGNGTYGTTWETDLHPTKGPAAYAKNALQFIRAMKAVDAHIDVGVVLTAPYNWPWGLNPNWNQTVLKMDGRAINFVVVHWYPQNPGSESDQTLLADPSQIPAMVAALKQEIQADVGPSGRHIQIFVDETNSVSSDPGKQTTSVVNALFLDNDYMQWLRSGVANVSWWDLHNGATAGNDSPSLYGSLSYGDYGILSNGSSINGVTEPPAETPFPAYYGYEMLAKLGRPGDRMVSATSNQSLLSAYAVRQAGGRLAVMLVNSSPTDGYQVHLDWQGFDPSGSITRYLYGEGESRVAASRLAAASPIAIGPYQTAVLVFNPSRDTPLPNVAAGAVVSHPTANPGAAETVTAIWRDHGRPVNNGTALLALYNGEGQVVDQTTVGGIHLAQGAVSHTVWHMTAPAVAGPYTVRAFLFTANLGALYGANQSAASILVTPSAAPVTPPSFSATATVTPASLATGQSVTLKASVTDTGGSLDNGILDFELHNGDNQKVDQKFWSVTLGAGQSVTETWTLDAPATAGTYSFQLGVFTSGWAKNLYWDSTAGTLTIH